MQRPYSLCDCLGNLVSRFPTSGVIALERLIGSFAPRCDTASRQYRKHRGLYPKTLVSLRLLGKPLDKVSTLRCYGTKETDWVLCTSVCIWHAFGIFVYIRTYIYICAQHAYVYIDKYEIRIYMYLYIHRCACIYTFVYMHIQHIYMHIRVCVHIYMYPYVFDIRIWHVYMCWYMTAYVYILVCMYGCAWVYIHTHVRWTFRHDIYIHMISIYVHTSIYTIHIYLHTRIHVSICIHQYTDMYINMHTGVYTYTYTYAYMCGNICIEHIYIYTNYGYTHGHIHTNVYIHTYIHVYTCRPAPLHIYMSTYATYVRHASIQVHMSI